MNILAERKRNILRTRDQLPKLASINVDVSGLEIAGMSA